MLKNRWKTRSLELSFIKKQRYLRIAPVFAFSILLIIGILTVSPITDSTNVTIAASSSTASNLNFYSIRDAVSLEVTPSSPSGNFVSSESGNDISFGITTDNYTGYTLMARTTDSAMRNGTGGSILALSSAVSAADFGASSSTALNNRWGYKPNKYNSADNTDFRAPSTESVILDQTSTSNMSTRQYTIGFGLRVDASLPAGEYLNETFVLEYVANPAPYVVNFLSGTADDIVNNLPSSFSGEAISAEMIPLPDTIPTRENYTFTGWCTIMPNAEPGGDGCKSRQFEAGTNYSVDYTKDTSVINLYAMWHSNYSCNKAAKTIGRNVVSTDAVCMQDINETVINSMTVGTQYSLVDFRDGKTYFIAKMNDGKVWMTQNLDLDLNSNKVYTHNNTDLGYTTNNLSSTWSPTNSTTSTIDDWSSDGSVARSYDAGNNYYYPESGQDYDNLSATCNNASTCNHYHIGNYYNFGATVAEHISDASSNQYAKMPDSVCPAGWRLPEAATDNIYSEFNNLLVEQGIVEEYNAMSAIGYATDGFYNARILPTYLNLTGFVNGYQVYTGYQNMYATNTIANSNSTYVNSIGLGGYYSSQTVTKSYGVSVRCVARAGKTVTVNFNGNGATSGSKDSIVAKSGDAVKLSNPYEKEHYSFVEWNTKDDGTGTSYDENGVFVISMSEESTVNLYAIWRAERVEIDCPDGYICYGSTFDDVTGTMNDGNYVSDTTSNIGYQSASDGADITLLASNFKRNGYGFAGWNTEVDGSGIYYGPNQTITAPNDVSTDGLELYAVWLEPVDTIQDWGGCNNLTVASYDAVSGQITAGSTSITALTDTRDGNVYAVARLADGNCWMIENLRLGLNGSNDSSKAQGFGGVFSGLASSESSGFSSSATSGNSKYASWDIGSTNTWYRIPRHNGSNVTSPLGANYVTNGNLYSYGSYYTWAAAIADTTNYETGNSHMVSYTSICPSGWHLPTGSTHNTSGSFYYLASRMDATSSDINSGNKFRSFPNNFTYAGNFDNNAATLRGEAGAYWSASVNNSGSAFNLGFTSSGSFTTENAAIKAIGLSVRCVLGEVVEETTISGLEYMQDFIDLTNEEKQNVIDSMGLNEVYELKDSRDEKGYSIAKLSDGNVWMTQNLDHNIVTTPNYYTHDNTDLGYETGASSTFTVANATIGANQLNGMTINGWGSSTDGVYSFDIGSNGGYGGYGNYYSFAAATAMDADSGYGSSNSDFEPVLNSICPAGWRLPRLEYDNNGGTISNDELMGINTLYNSGALNADNGLTAAPLSMMHVSSISNGELDSNMIGSEGALWYGVGNDTDGYIFSFGSSSVSTFSVDRSSGASVRCVLRR